jgi:hypothetical protein
LFRNLRDNCRSCFKQFGIPPDMLVALLFGQIEPMQVLGLILDGDSFCLGLNRVGFRDRSMKPDPGLLTGLKRGLIDWLTIALDHGLRGDPHDRLRIARRLTRLLLHPNGTRCNVGYGACDIRHARRQTLRGCSAA